MPQKTIRKRRRKRPIGGKWNRYGNKKMNWGQVAQRGVSLGLKALSMLNTEDKYFDTSATSVNATTTGSLYVLNIPVQGTAQTNRVGQSVKNKSIYIRYLIDHNATAGTTPQYLRIIVFKDKQANGALPALTDLLDSVAITSPRKLEKAKRFHIYCDDQIYVSQNDRAGHLGKCFIDLKDGQDDHTEYSANAGAIGDISTNAYYFLIFSNQSTNYPVFSYQSRIRFIDN